MSAASFGIGIFEQHRAKLESSAITAEVANARGYRSVAEHAMLERAGFARAQRNVPGLLIPLHDVHGNNAGYQYRPDVPRTRDGRVVKYETRSGQRMVLDVPPGARDRLDDPSVPLWITEGPLKADSAVSAGLCCVALLGVWSWRGTNAKGGKVALADFDAIAWNDRDVVLAFDSDSFTKVSVYDALVRLAAVLERRGAKVRYLHLADDNGAKVGLDNALAAGKSVEQLDALADTDPGPRPSKPAGEPAGVDGFHLTDLGNAERLAAAHGDRLRYVPAWGAWLAWDGARFRVDPNDVRVTELAADVPRRLWAKVPELSGSERDHHVRWATRSESAGAIGAMIRLARSTTGIAIDHDALDAEREYLNVENGTLDLRTGALLEHDPDRLITKLAPVRWNPDATAPTWLAFLERVLPDDEVRAFVQRAVGYSLTGLVSEQGLIVAIGEGANGKSTFITTIMSMLGDYAVAAPKDLLLASRHEPHPTSMTQLHGARFAAAVETEAGAKLAEAQVKQLTGGDRITARRMREDFWTFEPTHKLWLAANHRPRIHGRDHAIWRRIHLVPFDVTIPVEERDGNLTAKLALELDGILTWAVHGAWYWYEQGLAPPDVVTQATEDYRSEQDWFLRFLDDSALTITPGQGVITRAKVNDLYATWCRNEGVPQVSPRALADELRARGVEDAKSNGARVWRGLWHDAE